MKRPYIFRLEENKAIVRKVIEAENKKDLGLLDEFLSSDYVDGRNTHFEVRGLEHYKQWYAGVYKGFPDYNETIEDIIAEGDKVCVRLKITATHTGEYLGLAPTGKKVIILATQIWSIIDGTVVEGWGVADSLDAYRQLGVVEYKGFDPHSTRFHLI
jgi:predicted ester cyclase